MHDSTGSVYFWRVNRFWSNNCALMLTVIAITLLGCASPSAPSGGPRDEQPPSVVQEESSPNPMVNFDLDEIVLTFDEWVQLNNASSQMIVSPPIEPRLIPKLNRRSVLIPVDTSVLADNTTYIINFGEAVQDITERNPAINLTYVFSTGSFVDSLSVQASVYNARTGEPIEGVKVILHENMSDTAITKLLPSYFASTDVSGRCRIDYLRADTFRVYAIQEGEFGDYRHTPGELMGFVNDPVILTPDSLPPLRIALYEPAGEQRIVTVQRGKPHKVALAFEGHNISVEGETDDLEFWTTEQDTLYLWYNGADTASVALLVDNIPFDTIKLVPPDGRSQLQMNMRKTQRHPDEPAVIVGSHPVVDIDMSRVRLAIGDTVDVPNFNLTLDSIDSRNVVFSSRWQEATRYVIHALPGAFEDIFGGQNDTLRFDISIDERVNFSTLNLSIDSLDTDGQYIVILYQKEKEYERRIVDMETASGLIYPSLPVGEYSVEIVEDRNGNGRWDVGDIAAKTQPERIFAASIEGMRPGWDLDYTLTWPEE